MKILIIGLLTMVSALSFAQETKSEVNVEAKLKQSVLVQNTIQGVESDYNMVCSRALSIKKYRKTVNFRYGTYAKRFEAKIVCGSDSDSQVLIKLDGAFGEYQFRIENIKFVFVD